MRGEDREIEEKLIYYEEDDDLVMSARERGLLRVFELSSNAAAPEARLWDSICYQTIIVTVGVEGGVQRVRW